MNTMFLAIFLGQIDLFMGLFIIVLILIFASLLKPKKSILPERYWWWGIGLKLIGALFISLIYEYYYRGGDTTMYHLGGKTIYESLGDSFFAWFELVFVGKDNIDPNVYINHARKIYFWGDEPTYFVCRVLGITNLITFGSYMGNAFLFSFISFLGSWCMLLGLARMFPHIKRYLFLGVFCVPSVVVWGSGIFKDTLTFAALGFMIWAFLNITIFRRKFVLSWIVLALAVLVIQLVKIYILLSIAPALILWVLLIYKDKFKNAFVRFVIGPFVFAMAFGGGFYAISYFGQQSQRYNLESLAYTAETTARWLSYMSAVDGGSGYSLGDFDYSTTGMLRKALPAVNVTLFRPYLWEVKNITMLMAALESFALLCFTIYVFYKRGIARSFAQMISEPTILSFLVYSLIFAFAIGISTYNFGSLVRYKIPMLPFYVIGLVLILYPKPKRVVRKRVRIIRKPKEVESFVLPNNRLEWK
ncbi:hypothetical protein [Cesiribacter andamanensis]|uniref:Glycosyltransferase RgtA/B/C/D-like domain-containing protein n=1 Tax=Cesiribacter andamanensis AMV16 TaxID=1279009 RepID=M7P108_9BACT|nr:hypothetical protein [Cesiribacter andamanensis]EMR04259.1 hypothetical protein ADICEAN_00545 [Cesiribacter andamanensis AMV16]